MTLKHIINKLIKERIRNKQRIYHCIHEDCYNIKINGIDDWLEKDDYNIGLLFQIKGDENLKPQLYKNKKGRNIVYAYENMSSGICPDCFEQYKTRRNSR